MSWFPQSQKLVDIGLGVKNGEYRVGSQHWTQRLTMSLLTLDFVEPASTALLSHAHCPTHLYFQTLFCNLLSVSASFHSISWSCHSHYYSLTGWGVERTVHHLLASQGWGWVLPLGSSRMVVQDSHVLECSHALTIMLIMISIPGNRFWTERIKMTLCIYL